MRTLEGTRTPAKLTPDSTRDGWRVERMARSEERRVCRVIRDGGGSEVTCGRVA